MTDSSPPPSASSPLSLPVRTPGWGGKLLRGYSWWAVVLRSIFYVLLVVAVSIGAIQVLRIFSPHPSGPPAPRSLFLGEAVLALAALLAALLMSFLERQKMDAYGLPARLAFGKLFWQGVLAGLAEVFALVGLIAAGGGYSFGVVVLRGGEIARWACFWAVFMCLVGMFEEFLFRGYVQSTLGKRFGFWPAALVLSALFGAAHLSNKGESWVGAASVVVVGLVLCLTLARTGSLWFAVGLHASFNFGQTFVFSVPDSGVVFPGHLSSAWLHGPAWLTGGSVGPEGSLFSFLTMGLLAYAIHRIYPRKTESAPRA
ncbi:MAG: CPBP family intramembrane metalloprotease [Acidobacteriia bacterium]|nr:CPBP family intramembrane metalloprotease [Terriglobia bacterium]